MGGSAMEGGVGIEEEGAEDGRRIWRWEGIIEGDGGMGRGALSGILGGRL
jgi:hypothetical protein